jgi:hypothetical protein
VWFAAQPLGLKFVQIVNVGGQLKKEEKRKKEAQDLETKENVSLVQEERKSLPNHVPLFDETSLSSDTVFVPVGFTDASKRVPEAECFVSSSGDNHTAIRTHAQIEYTICVTSQTDHLRHGWVFPDVDGVLRETVGRDKL